MLEKLIGIAYFTQNPPKSTGKEDFNLNWLLSQLQSLPREIEDADVQATLLELTAVTIAQACLSYSDIKTLYLCGGGALNHSLVTRLKGLMPELSVHTTKALGIEPMWVEAAAFAWLAQQTIDSLPGSSAEVTGASRAAILGGIYLP